MSSPFTFHDSSTSDLSIQQSEWVMEEEDDESYDAKNAETFGDTAVLDTDWEADHEHYSRLTESKRNGLSKRDAEDEEEGISAEAARMFRQMATFAIADDDEKEIKPSPVRKKVVYRKKEPPPSAAGTSSGLTNRPKEFFDSIKVGNPELLINSNQPVKMPSLEEVERNMYRDRTPIPRADDNCIVPLRRAEDIEREIVSQSCQNAIRPINSMPSTSGLIALGPPHPMQHVNMNATPMPPPPLMALRPSTAAFVTTGPPPQVQGQNVPVMNSIFPGPSIMQILPNQTLHHNGLPPPPNAIPLPPGLPPPPVAHNGPIRPMLPNFGFHQSRVFYPSDRQQNQGPPALLYTHMAPPQLQQRNGNYNKSNQHNWPPFGPGDPNKDEYAGLMTEHDKNWLAQIQLLQLNNLHPYHDDYYYVMHQYRQQGSSSRVKLGPNSNKLNRDSPGISKQAYTPQQFENSLGKLQVGSVTAPRKIIDTDVVECIDNNAESNSSNVDSSSPFGATGHTPKPGKIKQALLEIEVLLLSVIKAEDYINPLAGAKHDKEKEKENNPLHVVTQSALTILADNKLNTYLSVIKGKKLLLRMLPLVGEPVVYKLTKNIVLNMVAYARKDPEHFFLQMLPFIRRYTLTLDLATINELLEPAEPNVSFILTNMFTISIIANMIERVDKILNSDAVVSEEDMNKWKKFITKLIEATSASNLVIERPVIAIEQNLLRRHLVTCTGSEENSLSDRAMDLLRALSIFNENLNV